MADVHARVWEQATITVLMNGTQKDDDDQISHWHMKNYQHLRPLFKWFDVCANQLFLSVSHVYCTNIPVKGGHMRSFEEVRHALSFLIGNIYVKYGIAVYGQTVGISVPGEQTVLHVLPI